MPVRQRFTPADVRLIGEARRRRIDVAALRSDGDWLGEVVAYPTQHLARMARRGSAWRLGGGRYLLADLGQASPADAASWQALVDAELSVLGGYYIGFRSVLEDHGLAPPGPEITAAIAFRNSRLAAGDGRILGRRLRVSTVAAQALEFGLERVRLSRTSRYLRSDLERTLVDCHRLPQLAGDPALWVGAWVRALGEGRAAPSLLLEYSRRSGPGALRRTGYLLSLLGHEALAKDAVPARVRRADRVTRLVADRPAGGEIDPFWRVDVNLPEPARALLAS